MNIEDIKCISDIFSIIPLQKSKKPYFVWKKYQSHRATSEEITRWNSELHPMLWGIITGLISKIIILDFDGEKGKKLLDTFGFKPHVRTGSGGFHCYFKHPGWKVPTLNSNTKKEMGSKWPGLDIRADGGYAAFSGHNERGEYEILRPINEPDELSIISIELKMFLGLDKPIKFESNDCRIDPSILVRKALAMVSQGEGRNNAGFWLAAQIRDNRYSQSETESIGLTEYLPHLPPLNVRGDPEPYTSSEWIASVNQAFAKPPRDPWERKASTATSSSSEGNREPGEDEEVQEERKDKFQFLTTQEILELPQPEWIVKGILPTQAISCMYGPPGAGKSFVVLDLLMCVVCGIPWMGNIEVKRGIALYIAGEGIGGISRRLAAWKSRYKEDPENHSHHRLYVGIDMPHFINECDVNDLLKAISRLPESPKLIAIDTLARCMAGGDENSAKDMGRLLESCEYIRSRIGSTILLIHHTGKSSDTIRGSSALMGAIETCLSVSNDNGLVSIRCDKQKDGEPFPELLCQLLPVMVYKGEEGSANEDNVTSCVIVPKCHQKTGLCQGVLAQIYDVCAKSAMPDGLTTSEWRDISGVPKRSFYRGVKQLVDMGWVKCVGVGHAKRFIPLK